MVREGLNWKKICNFPDTPTQPLKWPKSEKKQNIGRVVWWVGQDPPSYMEKKLFLNEYLGIFMHFESIFFIFLNLENGLFQTHPPTKSGKFQIWSDPPTPPL